MDLSRRLKDLHTSLGRFQPTEVCPWEVAAIFNALLAAVEDQHGNDPVVAAINPLQPGSGNVSATANCGAVSTAVGQLWQVVNGR